MNTMKICTSCQKPLETNAPDGLCPQCLLKTVREASGATEQRLSRTSALPMKRRLGVVALALALSGLALALPLGWWRIHQELKNWSFFNAQRALSAKVMRHRLEVIRREGAFPPTGEVQPTRLDPANAMPIGPSRGSTRLSFGPVIERELDFDAERKTAYLDLDIGEYVDPGPNCFFAGATPGGVDLMSRSIESNFDARWGIDLAIVPVEPTRWDATPEEIRLAVGALKGPPIVRLSAGRSTNTWFFRTSEGGQGVLQFLPPKADDDPSQVRLRYRLVAMANTSLADVFRSAASITDRDNDVSTVLIRGRIVTENFDVDIQFAFQRPDQASLLLLDHADQTPLHWATAGRLLLYDPIRGVIVNVPTPEGAPSFRFALNDGQLEFEFGHDQGGGGKSYGQDRFVLALADFVGTVSGAPQLKALDARTILFTGVSPQGNQVRAWVKPGLKFGVQRLELQARGGTGVFLEQIAVNAQIPAQSFVLPAVESLGSYVKEEPPSLSREAFFKLTTQWMATLTTRQAIRKAEQRGALERQIGLPVDWTAVTKTDRSISAIMRDALKAVDAASAGESRSPGSL